MSEDRKISMDVEVHRRKLLKILAASGGAVAASTMIPGKWLKPVVDMGVLPAHAQLSATCTASTTIDITNNSSELMEVRYRACQGLNRRRSTIPPVGGPNTLQIVVVEGSRLEVAPADHDGRTSYTLGGAATGLSVIDYSVDLHVEGNLSPGAAGTVVVADPPP